MGDTDIVDGALFSVFLSHMKTSGWLCFTLLTVYTGQSHQISCTVVWLTARNDPPRFLGFSIFVISCKALMSNGVMPY